MRRFVLVLVLTGLSVAGCSTKPVNYQALTSTAHLRPAKGGDNAFEYRDVSADFGTYSKVIIEPVTVYQGADAHFGSLSEEDRQIVATYMQRKFAEVLSTRFQMVSGAEPGALRIHLTLTGIKASVPVLSTISHVAPVGLAINGALQALGENGTMYGALTYAVEISDPATGKLLLAYITQQTPDALDVTASIGYLDAAKTGARIGARQLRDALVKAGMVEAIRP